MIGQSAERLLGVVFWCSATGGPVVLVVSAFVELRARWMRTAWIVDRGKSDGPLVFPPAGADPDNVVHAVSRSTYIQERLETGYPRARCGQPLWSITAPSRQPWSEQSVTGQRFDCPRCHGAAPRHMRVHGHCYDFGRRGTQAAAAGRGLAGKDDRRFVGKLIE